MQRRACTRVLQTPELLSNVLRYAIEGPIRGDRDQWLARVSRVARCWHDEAQKLLHEDLVLSVGHGSDAAVIRHFMACETRLRAVKTLTIEPWEGDVDPLKIQTIKGFTGYNTLALTFGIDHSPPTVQLWYLLLQMKRLSTLIVWLDGFQHLHWAPSRWPEEIAALQSHGITRLECETASNSALAVLLPHLPRLKHLVFGRLSLHAHVDYVDGMMLELQSMRLTPAEDVDAEAGAAWLHPFLTACGSNVQSLTLSMLFSMELDAALSQMIMPRLRTLCIPSVGDTMGEHRMPIRFNTLGSPLEAFGMGLDNYTVTDDLVGQLLSRQPPLHRIVFFVARATRASLDALEMLQSLVTNMKGAEQLPLRIQLDVDDMSLEEAVVRCRDALKEAAQEADVVSS